MKSFLYFIFLLSLLVSCEEKYTKLSEKESDKDELLKKINPDKNVLYWQVEGIPFQGVFFKKGNLSPEILKTIPTNENDFNGFFSGCQPMYCVNRITYFQDKKWNIVNDTEDLKKFIGNIDNESEAFLIAEINDYSLDFKTVKETVF